MRKGRVRRAEGRFVAEGPREVARARAAGLALVADLLRTRADRLGRRRGGGRTRPSEDELPRRAGRRHRDLRDPAARRSRRTARSSSSQSGSRSPATSARWRARPTPPVPTRCSSATPSATRGTRTRSAPRPVRLLAADHRNDRRRRRSATAREDRRDPRRVDRRSPRSTTPDRPPSWSEQKTTASSRLARLADARVAIPMRDGAAADSLNASTAAAVLLYEAVRQRAAT